MKKILLFSCLCLSLQISLAQDLVADEIPEIAVSSLQGDIPPPPPPPLILEACYKSLPPAGQLNGLVTDSKSGESLIGAHIAITKNQEYITTIVSDLDGNFSWPLPPGIYDLKVSYLGYEISQQKNVKIINTQKTEIDISLSPGITLEKIVVIAYDYPKITQCIMPCGSTTTCFTGCVAVSPREVSEQKKEKPISKDLVVNLFPNPAVHGIQVQANQAMESLYLFDATGKLLWSNNSLDNDQIEIPRNNLPAGQYYLKAQFKNESITKALLYVD